MDKIRIGSENFYLVHGDITKAKVDAIVNAANPQLAGGGGVDGAIHRAAGPDLLKAGQEIVAKQGFLATGEAVITPGFNLYAKHVIHTVGPIWRGGRNREKELLKKAYFSCLKLAYDHKIKTIAFPAISCGVYGFPLDLAAPIALDALNEGLKNKWIQEIYFYLYNKEVFRVFLEEAKRLFK